MPCLDRHWLQIWGKLFGNPVDFLSLTTVRSQEDKELLITRTGSLYLAYIMVGVINKLNRLSRLSFGLFGEVGSPDPTLRAFKLSHII
jgi:hypothetical protein